MVQRSKDIAAELSDAGIAWFYDEKGAVGRRYRRQDEAGTPFCVTVDTESLSEKTVTIRDRDTLEQTRVKIDEVTEVITSRING